MSFNKRIKLWESFSNEYYEKIDSMDYNKDVISFNPKYIDKLKSLISFDIKEVFDGVKYINIEYNDRIYSIIELEDEWFMVTEYDEWHIFLYKYKCDQFDGLIKFLKDKGII